MNFVHHVKTTALLLLLLALLTARPATSFAGPDTTAPSSAIVSPADGSYIRGTNCMVTGTATDDSGGSGVRLVEVSTDGGGSWSPATGASAWSYNWTLPDPAGVSLWRVSSAMIRSTEDGETKTVRVRHLLTTGGTQVRVGFVSGPNQPVTVQEAYIGNDAGGGAVSGNVRLTFGGSGSVTVPAGSITYSDPVPWTATRGGSVVVTSYGTGTSYGKGYDFPGYYEYGNAASQTRALANANSYVSGYDIYNALVVEVLQGGINTNENVLLVGDSITTGEDAARGTARSWAGLLGGKVNVYNSSRSGTTAAYESTQILGVSGRGIAFDKAIVSLGTNDIAAGASETDLENTLGGIFAALKSYGMKVIAGNIIPRSFTGTKETVRQGVNNWLKTLPNGLWAVVDFDVAVRDPANPGSMAAAYDVGDHVHPNDLGHAAMFGAIEREGLFTAGMLLEVTARATDNAGNVESIGPVARVFLDNDKPVSAVTDPADQAGLSGVTYSVTGTAFDGGGSGIDSVEVSTDGGATWNTATGSSAWSYDWVMPVQGSFSLMSRARDRAGNIEDAAPGPRVTVAAYGSPELEHYNWEPFLSGGDCGTCHFASSTFVAPGTRQYGQAFCTSCHSQASMAHDKAVSSGRGHSIMRSVTSAGARPPSYGNITSGEYSNQPKARLMGGGLVVCATCHNIMRKTEDFGRTWELTTTQDHLTYSLQRGGWAGYGYLVPKVYADTSLRAAPAYTGSRNDYLVDPSEYTYDENSGTVTFKTARPSTEYIYVSLDYPYLRASSQDNRLCSDCHAQAAHKGANCLTCHQAHGAGNLADIKDKLRTTDLSERPVTFLRYTGANSFAGGGVVYDGICEVCHTQTRYYRRDGTGLANHSGGFNYDRKDCTLCHSHSTGFAR